MTLFQQASTLLPFWNALQTQNIHLLKAVISSLNFRHRKFKTISQRQHKGRLRHQRPFGGGQGFALPQQP